jgi:hypothetical protein
MKSHRPKRFRNLLRLAVPVAGASACLSVHAAPFEIAVAPARFEISATGGERKGQSFDIYNVGASVGAVKLRTLDWTYSEAGDVTYHDDLLPDSCRPWVALERQEVRVPPHGKTPFRFQVTPPANVARGECRFMIAVEGTEPAQSAKLGKNGVGLDLPINGRIAIAVYVEVAGAAPVLTLGEIGVMKVHEQRTPYVTVHNGGDAHGRLEGALDVVDSSGASYELVPDGSPILPGQTRRLALMPKAEPGTQPRTMAFPLKSRGALDWDNGSFKIEAEFK